jgi:hypothetical protein
MNGLIYLSIYLSINQSINQSINHTRSSEQLGPCSAAQHKADAHVSMSPRPHVCIFVRAAECLVRTTLRETELTPKQTESFFESPHLNPFHTSVTDCCFPSRPNLASVSRSQSVAQDACVHWTCRLLIVSVACHTGLLFWLTL